MIVYGIPTCDTCKRAVKDLTASGFDVTFRDIRKDPLSDDEIREIVDQFGDACINKASTTYRGMSDFLKASESEVQIKAYPTVMKRPVVLHDGRWSIAWDEAIRSLWVV